MSSLIKHEEAPLVQHQPQSMIELLTSAAQQSSVENAVQLFELLERAEKREAEKAFTAAFKRLKFPPIAKTSKGHNSKYAAFDDIQAIIDPILASEGFTLTYSSGPANAKGEIPTYGLLAHELGFSRPGEIWLPPDGVATSRGGMNMNALQAVGSSTSYGQRYVAKLMLNLRFIGEDDDANATSAINEKQRDNIEDIIHEIGEEHRIKFLEFVGYKSVSDIQKAAYAAAINYLTAKRRQLAERAK